MGESAWELALQEQAIMAAKVQKLEERARQLQESLQGDEHEVKFAKGQVREMAVECVRGLQRLSSMQERVRLEGEAKATYAPAVHVSRGTMPQNMLDPKMYQGVFFDLSLIHI